jgi:hypothetical protein
MELPAETLRAKERAGKVSVAHNPGRTMAKVKLACSKGGWPGETSTDASGRLYFWFLPSPEAFTRQEWACMGHRFF